MSKLSLIICTLLIALTISCSDKLQKKEVAVISMPDKPAPVNDDKEDTALTLLKFTSGIRSILEDSKGNIWFGSDQEGVCVLHDGKFSYFTTENGLSDNQVRNIYEDKDGVIWFECGKGISSYNGKLMVTRQNRNYESRYNWGADKNDLWFKGDLPTGYSPAERQAGVYRYNGKELIFHAFPINSNVGEENYYSVTTPFIRSKNGTLWFGTYGGLFGYKDQKFIIIDNAYLGLSLKDGFLHIRTFMEDRRGNLWIGNNGIGVLRYDGNKTINFTEQHKLKKEDTRGNSLEKIFSIGEDSSGNIWFGTYGSGLWRYDGHSVVNFTEKDGIDCRQIWRIYKSRNGEMWFAGADPSGVYIYNGKKFERKY